MAPPSDILRAALADRYSLIGELGSGGMADVYLADDIKHPRKVAIKVLRREIAAVVGAERFLQEIRVVATLQHPHILGLIDSGIVAGVPYYVMPYVEGESLRDKLAREIQLPLDEAVTITTAVASALDYAHRHGVIHRDIKPGNILLHEGQAQVADFGIALALRSAGGERLTDSGLALGTPQYMSPEQGLGQRDITARSDVYALGCVVYEMLAGEPPFSGPTMQAIIAKATRDTPPPLRVGRPTIPVPVEAAVARALEKLPADRFGTAGEFAHALQTGATNPNGDVFEARSRRSRSPSLVGILCAALLLVAAAGIWGWVRALRPPAGRFARVVLELPERAGLPPLYGSGFAFSPRGDRLVYLGYSQGHRRLFLRSIDEIDSHPIPGTEEATTAFFSPDGASIGFHANGRLQRVPLAGGPVALIAEVDGHVASGSWGSDDAIVFSAPTGGLSRVSASGGTPEMLTAPNLDTGGFHTAPEVLPGGKAVVFVIPSGDGSSGQVAVVSVASRQVVRLLPGIGVRYSPTGHLVIQQLNGSLAVVPFDVKRIAITGTPSLLGETAEVDNKAGSYRLGGGNALTYLTPPRTESRFMLVDRQGARSPMPGELSDFHGPALSPDGHRLALINAAGVVVYDLAQGTLSLVAPGGGGAVSWTPDGQWITFTRFPREDNKAGDGLYRALANGGGQEQVLHRGPFCCATWLADGRSLITYEYNSPSADFWLVSLDSARATALFHTPFFESGLALSPDQRWLAYVSNESGRFEVHVRAYPGPGGRWQASTDGGSHPVWARNGGELFYMNGDSVISLRIATGGAFRIARRQTVFHMQGAQNYDVFPDGDRFVVEEQPVAPQQIVLVLNWFDEWARKNKK